MSERIAEILARMAERNEQINKQSKQNDSLIFNSTKQIVASTNSFIDSNNKEIASLIERIKNMSHVSASVQNKEADKKETNASESVMPKSSQESDLLENTQSEVNLYFWVDVSQNRSSNKEFENIGVSET